MATKLFNPLSNSKALLVGAAVVGGVALYKLVTGSKAPTAPTAVNFVGETLTDTRAKLKIPLSYLTKFTQGPKFEYAGKNGGIVFPYTPQISFESAATWSAQSLIHSNYNFYSYKNSAVSALNVSAKFTVQNDEDAAIYLSTILLLRALTKMPFGSDVNAGSPPPVCRFSAYGNFMLDNVPVIVSSVKIDLPDTVDYYNTYPLPSSSANGYEITEGAYEIFNDNSNSVPTLSTISLTLIPVYSRYEQLNFSVEKFLNGEYAKTSSSLGKGYL
jgi:hypothetical protein